MFNPWYLLLFFSFGNPMTSLSSFPAKSMRTIEMFSLPLIAFPLFSEMMLLFIVNFQFKSEEITNIINDFNEPGTLAPIGLFLGSTKYMVIQGESGAVIRGKKVTFFFLNMLLSYSLYWIHSWLHRTMIISEIYYTQVKSFVQEHSFIFLLLYSL